MLFLFYCHCVTVAMFPVARCYCAIAILPVIQCMLTDFFWCFILDDNRLETSATSAGATS